MVEDIEALRAVFGRDRRAVVVVDDVVLDQPVVAVVHGDAPLELRLGRAAVDGVADQRELVAVGGRGQRAAIVVHVDRIAADHVGGGVQRRVFRAPEVAEEGVANIGVGGVDRHEMPAGPGRARGADDDVAREAADVGQEVEHAVEVAGAEVIEAQGAGQREGAAVGGDRLEGPLFPLVLRVDPAAAGDLALLDVTGIRDDDPVARPPARDGRRQRQRGVPRARLHREPQEGRAQGRAVHGQLAEVDEAGAELLGIGDAAAGRGIGDDDLRRDPGRHRRGGGADLEAADIRHRRHAVIAHHHQVGHGEPGVDIRVDPQRAVHGQRVGHGGGGVDGHGVTGIDVDYVVGRRHRARLPGRRSRPVAAAGAANGRARTVGGEVWNVMGQRLGPGLRAGRAHQPDECQCVHLAAQA